MPAPHHSRGCDLENWWSRDSQKWLFTNKMTLIHTCCCLQTPEMQVVKIARRSSVESITNWINIMWSQKFSTELIHGLQHLNIIISLDQLPILRFTWSPETLAFVDVHWILDLTYPCYLLRPLLYSIHHPSLIHHLSLCHPSNSMTKWD